MSSEAALVGTQIRYEQKSYWRNPLAAFFSFAVPIVLFFVLVSTAGGGHDAAALGVDVLLKQYFTPSVLAFGVMSACFLNLSMTITRQREAGILKRLRGTPLPEWAIVGGLIGSSVIVAALISTVTVLFAVLVYDVHLPASHVLPLVVTIVLGAGVFCSLGIAVSALMPNADSAPALVNFPYFILMSASGGFGPVSGGVAKVTGYLPLRPFITAVYRAFDPTAFGGSGWQWHNLGTLAVWGVVGIVIATRRFRWTPRNG